MSFINSPGVLIPFSDNQEKGFFIKCMGFNNFYYIKPIKYFRIQRYYTLHIVLSGSGTLKVSGKEFKVKSKDMFFLPPDISFCYYPDNETPWKYVWFEFSGENSFVYREKLGFNRDTFVAECRDFDRVNLLISGILNGYKNNNTGYYEVLSVFYKILDINIENSVEKSNNVTEDIINYINSHYAKASLTLEDICKFLNISHSYICKIFKNTTGRSVKRHIINVRLTEACKLLKSTSLGVKEIAYSVGYTDEIHFMKAFKQFTGKSPTNYRKDYNNEL